MLTYEADFNSYVLQHTSAGCSVLLLLNKGQPKIELFPFCKHLTVMYVIHSNIEVMLICFANLLIT